MTIFNKMIEDPTYDDDGVMIDEDMEFDELEETDLDDVLDDLSPFETINS